VVLLTGALFAGVAMSLARRAFTILVVNGHSMSPTLSCGDRVLLFTRWPRRLYAVGQIVAVRPPSEPMLVYVKRIAALRVDSGTLKGAAGMHRAANVPPDHAVLLGDNRRNSLDSRTWGPIPIRNLQGRVVFRLAAGDHNPVGQASAGTAPDTVAGGRFEGRG
jgi:signal peptidase I